MWAPRVPTRIAAARQAAIRPDRRNASSISGVGPRSPSHPDGAVVRCSNPSRWLASLASTCARKSSWAVVAGKARSCSSSASSCRMRVDSSGTGPMHRHGFPISPVQLGGSVFVQQRFDRSPIHWGVHVSSAIACATVRRALSYRRPGPRYTWSRVEPGHGPLFRFVLSYQSVDFIPVRFVVSPRIAQVFGAQGRLGVQQFGFAGSQ